MVHGPRGDGYAQCLISLEEFAKLFKVATLGGPGVLTVSPPEPHPDDDGGDGQSKR